MAINALVCFAGQGLTVAISVASPCVVTLSNHGLRAGSAIYLSTTGTLPTGLSQGVKYFINPITSSTFNLYTDAALTEIVDTSGTQSGTHTIYGAYFYELSSTEIDRYGTPYRIYSSLRLCLSGLLSYFTANPDPNIECVIEFGDAFVDIITSGLTVNVSCGTLILQSKINEVRSAAFHNAVIDSGYVLETTNLQPALFLNMYNITVDGIDIHTIASNGTAISSGALAAFIKVKNNIIRGNPSATGQKICTVQAPGDVYNNIIVESGGDGINIPMYGGLGVTYYNNLITKCTGFGVVGNGSTQGRFYNNISIGNGINWGKWPNYISYRGSNNYGDKTDFIDCTVNIANNVSNIVIPGHGHSVGNPITFSTDGTLPTVSVTGQPLISGKTYIVRTVVDANTITISTSTSAGAFIFTDNGTGSHKTTKIWSGDGSEKYIDFTTPDDIFMSWSTQPYDFRPANGNAPHVDTGITVYKGDAVDMLGAIRPNYNLGITELWDGGPLEFDHGYGLAPSAVPVNIANLVADSSVTIEDMGGNVILAPVIIEGTSHSFTYTYTGDITVRLKVRNRRNGNWQPYDQIGVITATGCNFYVSQVGAVV